MRTLNLSRLARASESSFFKKEQTQQALNIRSKLSDSEITKVKSVSQQINNLSPDILPEISAHSAYREIIKNVSIEQSTIKKLPPRPLFTRLVNRDSATISIPANSITSNSALDPKMMRALGTGKLGLLQLQKRGERPLPGGEKYADGAVVGLASISIASAIVAGVGLIGGTVLWQKPEIIQSWKNKSVRFRQKLENGRIGAFVRQRITPRIEAQESVIFSEESKHKASVFARAAVGLHQTTTSTGSNGVAGSQSASEDQPESRR